MLSIHPSTTREWEMSIRSLTKNIYKKKKQKTLHSISFLHRCSSKLRLEKSNNSSNIFRIYLCLWSGVCSLKNGIVHLLFMPSKTVKYGKSNMMLLQHMSMRAPDFYYRNIFYDAISYFCNKISLILRIWLQNCI